MSECVPALPGSYALHIDLPVETLIQIGKLGAIIFSSGNYIYLGSAMGPGGIRARLMHHERIAGKPHWHIDWLRQKTILRAAWFSIGAQRLECDWSQRLLRISGVTAAAPGFGASDCCSGCAAHLVRLPSGFVLEELSTILDASYIEYPFFL